MEIYMKNNEEKKTSIIPRPLYNQIILLFQDNNFLELVKEQREILKGKLDSFNSKSEAVAGCYRAIRTYARNKDLPESWADPIFNFIMDNELDVPLEGGIALKVGRQEVTGKGEMLFIRDKNGRLVGKENSISIVITAKVSADRIIKFVKKHKKTIEELQKTINLPEYQPLNWRELEMGLKIISLRDEEKLSFSDIEARLASEKESVEESDKIPGAEVIKNLYHLYKKRLSS